MKKYLTIIPMLALFFAFSAHADVALKDKSDIVGVWDVHDESTSLTAPRRHTEVEWNIKADDTIQIKSSDKSKRLGDTDITIKYSVENGQLKRQAAPGREKYQFCKVIEKEGKNMTLQCGYFFFMSRK